MSKRFNKTRGLMGKIKVLYIIGTLQIGGAERALQKLVTNLPKSKVEIHLMTLFDLPEQSIKKELVPYAKITELKIKGILNLPKAIKTVKTYIQKNKIQIVHSFMFHAHIVANIAARKTNAKIINSWRLKPKKLRRTKIERIFKKRVNLYTPNSKVIKKFLIEQDFPAEKIVVIPNAVDIPNKKTQEQIKKLKQELKLTKDWPVIISQSNLKKQKDIPTTLKAIAYIIKVQPVYFVNVGGGNKYANEREYLEKIVKDLGIQNNVIFTGYRDDYKEKILPIADVWTLSSLYEGQCNALLEAMAFQKPIVCTNIPENIEVVKQNKEALTFKPKNSKAQATQILKILKNKKLKEELTKNAYKKVLQSYTIKEYVNKTLAVYSELLKK